MRPAGENVTWHLKHGSWWMFQWCWDGWVSFGVHVDLRRRIAWTGPNHDVPKPYGPYVDVHFLCAALSLGVNPVYSGELECSTSISRGGIRAGSS